MDVTLPVRRDAPQWARRTGLAAALLLAALLCPGLPYLSGAESVTRALDVTLASPGLPVDVLGLTLARVALALPVGDAPFRTSLVACLCAAVSLSFWVRTALATLASLRPAAHARRTPEDVAHEPVAALGAAASVLCAPPFFALAKGASGGGVPLLLLSLWVWAAAAVLREVSDGRSALAAAFIAGLAVADSPAVGAMIAPCGFAVWGFGLARGAKWAPLAPTFFAVGLVVLVGAAALGAGPGATLGGWWHLITLRELVRAIEGARLDSALEIALALGESLGVIGCLLAVIGWAVLAWRASGVAGVVLFAGWAAVMMAAAENASAARVGAAETLFGLAISLSLLPMAVGILHFANKLGRAHVAGAVALAVMAAVAPAASGGLAKWLPDGRLPLRLLMRAHSDVRPRSVVDPGSAPLDVMFRYGAALGLRPDVTVQRRSE